MARKPSNGIAAVAAHEGSGLRGFSTLGCHSMIPEYPCAGTSYYYHSVAGCSLQSYDLLATSAMMITVVSLLVRVLVV